jgi:predicted N-acetyltransferase YhbS
MLLPVTPERVSGLMALQRASFPPTAQESEDALGSIWIAAPEYCRVAVDGSGVICGYVLAHPWIAGELPPLQAPLERLPEVPTAVFLHDLAVADSHRGLGLGRTLAACILDRAARAGIPLATLLAAPGSFSFWERLGFARNAQLCRRFDEAVKAAYGFPGEFWEQTIRIAPEVGAS